jgi:hypothetical protein
MDTDTDITYEDVAARAGSEAEQLSDVSATAVDAGSRGSIVWHPMPYRPDRN